MAQTPPFLRTAEKIKKGLRDNIDWDLYFEQLRRMSQDSSKDAILDLILDEFPLFMERYQTYLDWCAFLGSFNTTLIGDLAEEFVEFSREEQIRILKKILRMHREFYGHFLGYLHGELGINTAELDDLVGSSDDLVESSEEGATVVVCCSSCSEYSDD